LPTRPNATTSYVPTTYAIRSLTSSRKFKMHNAHDIENHTAIRRAALAKGQTVLTQLDKRGNVAFNVMPLVFDTVAEAKAFIAANKTFLYAKYWPIV
jgi:hypothetical protein